MPKTPEEIRRYAREWTRKNRESLNARRRELYKLNPLYLQKSQKRLARWKGGILKIIQDRKMKTGCERCGYKKYYGALEFHHKDRSTKSFKISDTVGRSKNDILKEMKKCIILCRNCHAEVGRGL